MRNLIVAHPDHDLAVKLFSMLLGRGLPAEGVATTGAQVLQQASQNAEGGVVVCPFRLHDFKASEIRRRLSPAYDLLVLVNSRQAGELFGEGLYTLLQPGSSQDLVDAVAGLLNHQVPPQVQTPHEALDLHQTAASAAMKNEESSATRRSAEEQAIIEQGKQVLMTRRHMSESEAHRFLQKRSMESGIRIVELARRLLQ
jgi:response regulator NasT